MNNNVPPRAERVPLETTMRYRNTDSRKWRQARMVNVSRSGVLFRTRQPIPLQAPVDLLLSVPEEITKAVPLHVMCCGYVSRIQHKSRSNTIDVAAAFIDFNLLDRTPQGRRTRKLLKARDRTRDLFHKIRNELQIVVGTCEIAMQNPTVPIDMCAQLSGMLQAAHRAAELVSQIDAAGHIERYRVA